MNKSRMVTRMVPMRKSLLAACMMLVVVLAAPPASSSDWQQQGPYDAIAVSVGDDVRYASDWENSQTVVLATDGTVLSSIDRQGGLMDAWGDYLVLARWGDFETGLYMFVDLLHDGTLVRTIRQSHGYTVSDVAVGSEFMAYLVVGPMGSFVEGYTLGGGIGPDVTIPVSGRAISIDIVGERLAVFEYAKVIEHSIPSGELLATTILDVEAPSVRDDLLDGRIGFGDTYVTMRGSDPDSEERACSIAVHRSDGSLQDCFLKQPGGARLGFMPARDRYGQFDVDACGGIVVPDATRDDGDLTGHKLIPSNRDPGCFLDTLAHAFAGDIAWIGKRGITKGCNPPLNDRFCADEYVTRGQMAAFLDRALGWPDTEDDFFDDDNGSLFEASINRMAAAGVTKGCNPAQGNTNFCPDNYVTRAQIASFLVRAMGYTDDGGGNLFVDDNDSIHEGNIDRLGAAGVTKGCNPSEGNTMFCPNKYATRGQMAAFLHRSLKDTSG